jgi:hypothetical protein
MLGALAASDGDIALLQEASSPTFSARLQLAQ